MPKRSSTAHARDVRKPEPRPLAPFSYMIMCQLNKLPEPLRYGRVLEEILELEYGHVFQVKQVYVTLLMLADKKGYITGKPGKSAAGTDRDVTIYTLTEAGKEALERARPLYEALGTAYSDPPPRIRY